MPASAEGIVDVSELRKIYGLGSEKPIVALDGIDLTVYRSEIFGLLGPNGAGKTTTIGILTTRVIPNSGRVRVAGIDPVKNPIELKKLIAVVPQQMNLDRSLRVRENLLFHAEYFGVSRRVREQRADELLGWLELSERANAKIDEISGGMRQRVMIARALMHDPQIVFLDEATLGLDPASRLLIWERIRELHAKGLTIILTTHYMEEAEELCNRVAIIDHGKILALDTPQNLKKLLPGGDVIEMRFAQLDPGLVEPLRRVEGTVKVEVDGDRIRLYVLHASEVLPRVMQALNHSIERLSDIHLSHATLEDVFILLTGKGLRT